MAAIRLKPLVDRLDEHCRRALEAAAGPALLGRMTVVPYFPLSPDIIRRSVRMQLDRIGRRVADAYRARFAYDDAVVDLIAARCTETASGARNVESIPVAHGAARAFRPGARAPRGRKYGRPGDGGHR